jgi:hypothetical protein
VDWLRGIIAPIHKDGEMRLPLNYRPITLLSIAGKVYTGVLQARLMAWAEKSSVIVQEQGGFRPRRGCPEQVFTLTELIKLRRLNRKHTYACFIDIRKAYDTVWHAGLKLKLRQAGIHGPMYDALCSLYSGCESSVRLGGKLGYTDFFPIETGVRQGCILSPLLYSLFINDLALELKNLEVEGVGVPIVTRAEGTIFIAAVDAVSSCRPSSPSRRPSSCGDFGARVFSVPLMRLGHSANPLRASGLARSRSLPRAPLLPSPADAAPFVGPALLRSLTALPLLASLRAHALTVLLGSSSSNSSSAARFSFVVVACAHSLRWAPPLVRWLAVTRLRRLAAPVLCSCLVLLVRSLSDCAVGLHQQLTPSPSLSLSLFCDEQTRSLRLCCGIFRLCCSSRFSFELAQSSFVSSHVTCSRTFCCTRCCGFTTRC